MVMALRSYSKVEDSSKVRGLVFLFFFNDTATTEIYTLSLHDALPIFHGSILGRWKLGHWQGQDSERDRKSTRLNSSHQKISYAVFCLKKKNHSTQLRAEVSLCVGVYVCGWEGVFM